LITPTGTRVRAYRTGNFRSLSLDTTIAASTSPDSTSTSRCDATLTSEPFSSRWAYEMRSTLCAALEGPQIDVLVVISGRVGRGVDHRGAVDDALQDAVGPADPCSGNARTSSQRQPGVPRPQSDRPP